MSKLPSSYLFTKFTNIYKVMHSYIKINTLKHDMHAILDPGQHKSGFL